MVRACPFGLISAGLAFALQRVVTSLAGYLLILRGSIFNSGDRIKMGGVRGDVIRIGFIQTTIMEMGQPPAEQSEKPGISFKDDRRRAEQILLAAAERCALAGRDLPEHTYAIVEVPPIKVLNASWSQHPPRVPRAAAHEGPALRRRRISHRLSHFVH